MSITPLEIREYRLKGGLFGYNKEETDTFKELVAEALGDAKKKSSILEDELKTAREKLIEHEEREKMLKDTITTAQKMVDDLKGNATKEAELIIVEARHQADAVTRQAHKRVLEIQQEIQRLRNQRIEFETKLKAVLEYHTSILTIDEKDSKKLDEEANKLKYLHSE